MQSLRSFVVVPALPEPLEPLRQLAYNLWWTWTPGAIDLFRRLDPDLWEELGHNPVALLWRIDQERLTEAAADKAYVSLLTRVADQFYIYRHSRTWFDEHYPQRKHEVIAYFSAEFGLHECLPIYSGGLGVLAGDHLKSASDLGIPLVALGLMYRSGYFIQELTEDGWQLERYPHYDFHQWPVSPVRDSDERQLRVAVKMDANQTCYAQIWRVGVGRVTLYLLDCDVPENRPEMRAITSRLYGGDNDLRIQQEILLGIGGLRALRAVGVEPTVCHMNEGHAAFLALERIRSAMTEHKLSYAEALEAVSGGNVFTTHTPVPAGIDRFDAGLVERRLGWMADELGITHGELLALGREGHDALGAFNMPNLALRTSYRNNGVSRLHGDVSRGMWQSCWPEVPRQEIPIGHVTNGVHLQYWTSPQMADLLDQYLGPAWFDEPDDPDVWRRISEIPDTELWRVHERRRERMIASVRQRLRAQLGRRGAPQPEIRAAEEVLDPDALTIGFARRFAPYKRATLLFRNLDRLRGILASKERPVQFVFAGKAHPADSAGKELIKEVAALCNRPEFRRRIVFLENYDMGMARVMVRGVDIWLNNPLHTHEASGTSGMKVPPNGGLNLSCLDGWWPEAYNGENGWAIGDGRLFEDLGYQDHVESEALYNLLEREIVPMFYERSADDVPRRWIARVKDSMRTICPVFNTHRMLKEYNKNFYQPAVERYLALCHADFKLATELTKWKEELRKQWSDVRVVDVATDAQQVLKVGDRMPLKAHINLGRVKPDQVAVEVYYGQLDADGELTNGVAASLKLVEKRSNGEFLFAGDMPCDSSGRYGYSVRVVPQHADLPNRLFQGMVAWAP